VAPATGPSGRRAEGFADGGGEGNGAAVGLGDEDVGGAHAGGGVSVVVAEFDDEGHRSVADFFDNGDGSESFTGTHGEEEVGFSPTQRGRVGGRGEPGFPAKGGVADKIFHNGVGQAERARIKNDAGRIGVVEADGEGLLVRLHGCLGTREAERRSIGNEENGGVGEG